MQKVKIFNQEMLEKFKVNVRYVQLTCRICEHGWGYYFNNSDEIDASELVCRECSKTDRLKNILSE
jgi:hypothetical protein